MVDAVFHTEKAWIQGENTEFKELIHKLGTYKRAGQQILFLEVILAFISQYYGGLSEWPSYKMQDVSQVELHDMSYIENAFQETEGKSIPKGENPSHKVVQEAYKAANDMLRDLFTNPIFERSGLPKEVLNNLVTIFALQESDISYKKVTVTIDGKKVEKRVPYFDNTGNHKSDWTVTVWDGSPAPDYHTPVKVGTARYQAWVARMEGIQSKLQETNTLFTNMSSTEQSKYKFIMGNLKEFLGTWKSLNKNLVSVRNTALQNMARG